MMPLMKKFLKSYAINDNDDDVSSLRFILCYN